MKLSEVVNQVQLVLPKYTNLFSTTLGITSITATGGVATIVTSSAHGMTTGYGITISDVEQKNPIASVTKDGLIFTFTTTIKHDLTLDYPGYETVALGGFTDPLWNDSFTLTAVPDRNTFKVQSTNTLPVLNAGEFLSEVRIDGINGRHSVIVVDTTTFTISGSFLDGNYENGTIKTAVRIAGSVSAERALEQYTAQGVNDLWLFVVMGDASVSKNRSAYNDAIATVAEGEDIRIRMIDEFSVFLVKNTKYEESAVDTMDIMRHDLLLPITKTLFGVRFTTGLTCSGDFRAILTGHNIVEYDRATLVYQYGFQFSYDLVDDDTADPGDTRAFSEIDYTQEIGGDDTTNATVLGIVL